MRPATVFERYVANLIDRIILVLFMVTLKFLIPGVTYFLDHKIMNLSEKGHVLLAQTATYSFSYAGHLTTAIAIVYFVYFEQSKWQGTVGKKYLKIKVVDTANKRLSLSKALKRYLVYIAPSLFFCLLFFFVNPPECLNAPDLSTTCGMLVVTCGIILLLLWEGSIFFTKDKRTTYDILSQTKVVGESINTKTHID